MQCPFNMIWNVYSSTAACAAGDILYIMLNVSYLRLDWSTFLGAFDIYRTLIYRYLWGRMLYSAQN